MKMRGRLLNILFLSFICINVNAFSNQSNQSNHLIIQINKSNIQGIKNRLLLLGYKIKRPLIKDLGIYLATIPKTKTMNFSTKELISTEGILHAQPDYDVSLRSVPNDTNFSELWNFNDKENKADIEALKAWDITTGGTDSSGNSIVVAVVDGGIDLKHRELINNIWVNKNEIPGNGIDDDQNGFIDDINGWNVYAHNGEIPVEPHGTHVAGIIGAKGNNNQDVVGVNWNIKIMAVAASSYKTSVVLEGYGYVLKQKKIWLETKGKRGANVVATNSSFGVDYADCNSGDFLLWNKIYDEMGKVGILSVAASINSEINVDELGDVPTGCKSDYLVTVTNTTRFNEKYIEAGYGKKSIDLGAPGTEILSTTPNDQVEIKTGTSMATPHVTGAVALLHSAASSKFNQMYLKNPAKAALLIKKILLHSVSPMSDLKGNTVSGGKLNLANAVAEIKNF